MSRIRPRLMSCHWSFDLRWVKISGHREQLGPCGSTSHFVNDRHSRVKLGVRLVLEVLAKLMVGENSSWEFPKVGVRLILEVCLILEIRRYMTFLVQRLSFQDLEIIMIMLLAPNNRYMLYFRHYKLSLLMLYLNQYQKKARLTETLQLIPNLTSEL